MDLWFYVNEIELFFASQQTGIFLYHCIDINDQTQKCANNVYWQLLIFCAYLYWYFAPMYIDILRQYININDLTQKCANNVLIFCANLASPRHSPSAGHCWRLAPMYWYFAPILIGRPRQKLILATRHLPASCCPQRCKTILIAKYKIQYYHKTKT